MPYQLRYVYPTGQIAWDVAVHMGKIDDLKVEIIPLVVDANMIRSFVIFMFYRCLVGSVVRAPVCTAGGCGSKAQRDQHSGSLNN